MTEMSPEIAAAVQKLNDVADRVEAAASEMWKALAAAQEIGVPIRQSDADTIRTRFAEQIPYSIRFRAGQLMPPITGQLNVTFDSVAVEAQP